MTDFHVIIPARYESTRLPAKALKLIGDKTMIEHVCLQASLSGAQSVTVATDNQEIVDIVTKAGFVAVMTRQDHKSGSDRVFEATCLVGLSDDAIIVNVQGDEPFIPPKNIERVASLLADSQEPMATLCSHIYSADEVLNPNAVKVVFSSKNKALYFSRALIPYNRDSPVSPSTNLTQDYYRHIGIYAYRKAFLKTFVNWPTSQLEKIESLEQLRALDNGCDIAINCLDETPPAGVDTVDDLLSARQYYEQVVQDGVDRG